MLNINENLRYIYKNDTLPSVSQVSAKTLVIEFPTLNLTITNDKIVSDSFSLTESICSDTDLVFGSCESAEIKFTVADIQQDLKGQLFTIKQIVNNTYEMPLGTYIVESAKKQNDKRFKDVVAYDLLKNRLDVDVSSWYNSLFSSNNTSVTLAQFRASFFTYVGLTVETQTLPNDSMTVTKTIEPTKLLGRDVARAIGEINGMFGHMTRDNKFKYIGLSGIGLYPSETLYPSDDLFPSEPVEILGSVGYKSLEYEEYIVQPIDKLQIRTDEGDVGTTVGIGTNAYVIEGNFLVYGKNSTELQTIASNVFLVIKNKYYRPHTSVIPGLPYLEVGDSISIVTSTDAIETFVFSRTLTGIQALTDTLSATGNEYREQNFSSNTEIQQLKAKTLKITKNVDELSTEMSDIEEDLQSQITQTSEQIELKVNKAGIISSINASTEGVKIQASKVSISGYVTFSDLSNSGSTTINGANITTGSINCDRLNGGTITGQIISGSTIIGGSISGASITSHNTSGTSETSISGGYFTSTSSTYGTSTTILGGNIDTNTVSARSVSVNGTSVSVNGHTHSFSSLSGSLYTSSINISSGSTSGQIAFSNGNGVGWAYAERTYAKSSDLRLKYDIQSLENIDNFYMNLKPKKFRFKDGFDNYVINTGLIAQEVLINAEENSIETGMIYETENVLNQGEFCTEGWHYNLKYDDLHAFHIKMIQKHENEIQSLKEENQSIKDELSELKALLKERGVI